MNSCPSPHSADDAASRSTTARAAGLRRCVAMAVLLASGSALAETLVFSYTGNGAAVSVSAPFPCATDPAGCIDVVVNGVANDWNGATSPIAGSWLVEYSFSQGLATGLVAGIFNFTGVDGAPSFGGTATGLVQSPPGLPPGVWTGTLNSVITNGTGAFMGATGFGWHTLTVNFGAGATHLESGVFSLTPVPEPASWALFGMGLLAAGAWARRQGRR
jgi:hypothetical protein